MMRLLSFFLVATVVFAIKEPRTGIEFPEKYKGSALQKLGVRTKGPIKVSVLAAACRCLAGGCTIWVQIEPSDAL